MTMGVIVLDILLQRHEVSVFRLIFGPEAAGADERLSDKLVPNLRTDGINFAIEEPDSRTATETHTHTTTRHL